MTLGGHEQAAVEPAASRRAAILNWLATDPQAPRVFSPASLMAQLQAQGWDLPRHGLMEALGEWSDRGVLDRVRRGIYLNLQASPTPTLAEATPWVRQGAVVSLGTVLGQAGFLTHSENWITAVVPLVTSRAVGTFRVGGRIFQIAGLHPKQLPNPEGVSMYCQDAYDETAWVPTATPEKALLDWLYLSRTSPLWSAPEPEQILHPERLDRARLDRLAQHMDLVKPWAAFVEQAQWGPAPRVAHPGFLRCQRTG